MLYVSKTRTEKFPYPIIFTSVTFSCHEPFELQALLQDRIFCDPARYFSTRPTATALHKTKTVRVDKIVITNLIKCVSVKDFALVLVNP
jgi:hypothetical protein